jgi:hypothetical protein
VFVSERKIKSNFRGIAADVVARNVKLFSDTFISFFCSFRLLPSEQASGEQQLSISSFSLSSVSTCAVHYSNGKQQKNRNFSLDTAQSEKLQLIAD